VKSAGGIVCGEEHGYSRVIMRFRVICRNVHSLCIVKEDEQAVSVINPFERLSFEMELTGIFPNTGSFEYCS